LVEPEPHKNDAAPQHWIVTPQTTPLLWPPKQCYGSRGFLTRSGSRSEFRKRPDLNTIPDPDLYKLSAKFLLEIFLAEKCSKKYIHEPKAEQQIFVQYLWLLFTLKKVQDPNPSKKVRIRPNPDPQHCSKVAWITGGSPIFRQSQISRLSELGFLKRCFKQVLYRRRSEHGQI
jgi:hypothetical protein